MIEMISERDIYRTANLVVEQHGAGAALWAAQRADELLDSGDTEGAAVWRRIQAAVEDLQTVEGTVN